ncbi:hypothetical protein K0U27_10690 [archaeon]|nr:hypothetical protein [archaeon]
MVKLENDRFKQWDTNNKVNYSGGQCLSDVKAFYLWSVEESDYVSQSNSDNSHLELNMIAGGDTVVQRPKDKVVSQGGNGELRVVPYKSMLKN